MRRTLSDKIINSDNAIKSISIGLTIVKYIGLIAAWGAMVIAWWVAFWLIYYGV